MALFSPIRPQSRAVSKWLIFLLQSYPGVWPSSKFLLNEKGVVKWNVKCEVLMWNVVKWNVKCEVLMWNVVKWNVKWNVKRWLVVTKFLVGTLSNYDDDVDDNFKKQ